MSALIYLASYNYNPNIPITIGGVGASLILVFFLRHLHWGLALALGVVFGGILGVGVGWAGEWGHGRSGSNRLWFDRSRFNRNPFPDRSPDDQIVPAESKGLR